MQYVSNTKHFSIISWYLPKYILLWILAASSIKDFLKQIFYLFFRKIVAIYPRILLIRDNETIGLYYTHITNTHIYIYIRYVLEFWVFAPSLLLSLGPPSCVDAATMSSRCLFESRLSSFFLMCSSRRLCGSLQVSVPCVGSGDSMSTAEIPSYSFLQISLSSFSISGYFLKVQLF